MLTGTTPAWFARDRLLAYFVGGTPIKRYQELIDSRRPYPAFT